METRREVDSRHGRVHNSTANLEEIEYDSNSEGDVTLFSEDDPFDDAFFVARGNGEPEFDEKEEEIVIGNKIMDRSNGDVAVDHYHHYLEDVGSMASPGVNNYRFSISWARILPKGRFRGINMLGIDFYNNLIDALLSKGIQPFATVHHFDIPQELEDRYEAWLSPISKEDFQLYADVCFKHFGDWVKHWVTFNEPNIHMTLAYMRGEFLPCHCSGVFENCSSLDSEKDPFIAAHNIILSHAAAVDTYRKKYQKEQNGTIGLVLHSPWFEPISDTKEDKLVAKRALSFFNNWISNPIIFGKYPSQMVEILGNLLPEFSRKE
ncbi:hypothetical protein CDL15_Pgr018628 [Punica granatum]|uniref:Uncharacterized protein n=1 Tax=Punica granatum TaxID=22663 RepID=A0A218WZZ7_PUNGR|nr:hypothetical protein CDL15_Pgr018628 [Punica granatum]